MGVAWLMALVVGDRCLISPQFHDTKAILWKSGTIRRKTDEEYGKQ